MIMAGLKVNLEEAQAQMKNQAGMNEGMEVSDMVFQKSKPH